MLRISRPVGLAIAPGSHSRRLKTGRVWCVTALTVLAVSLKSVCAQVPTANEISDSSASIEGYELQFPALGTLVTLKAYSDDLKPVEIAFERVRLRIEQLENTLSDYDRNSEVSQLSIAAVGREVRVSDDLATLLRQSANWQRRSNGLFDVSMGALTRLHRKYRRVGKMPPQEAIEQALETSGWNQVVFDSKQQTLKFGTNRIGLDFGGIGKGFIVDEAYAVLQQHDLPVCLVDISGNMRLGDPPPGRKGWKIAVASLASQSGNPKEQKARGSTNKDGVMQLSQCALATSGDLWQYVEVEGVRRSHILDPRTGLGVIGPISATVIAESATDADAFATIACIGEKAMIKRVAKEMRLAVCVSKRTRKVEGYAFGEDVYPEIQKLSRPHSERANKGGN